MQIQVMLVLMHHLMSLLALVWCFDIMQTFMELIETCINKEPNANPSDVSTNASPNVLPVEAITKAPIFTTGIDVKKENDSQPTGIEGRQFHDIA
jgi:hypothetical protein